ncbi:PREDICTED: uncharacterized protein LOC109169491 [Ipomoea nil]|uniref:uncharacterized protein LOC109169491 n=1 Tax=Ipomoea nil TaxID=35883 RepID=UPI000900DDAF|nr:PREDICTED: uncharacterized protein LOC109169491 [Ipomoea nil]
MATNGSNEIKINIRIRDSQQTLRTCKRSPVPILKDQIAWYTGVSSNRQQLVFRGRDLRNDKRLSDYNVEDGDTLHLNIINLDGGSSSGQHQGNNHGSGIPNISEPFVRPLLGRPLDGAMFQIFQRTNEEDDFDRTYCDIHYDEIISGQSSQRELWRAFNVGNSDEQRVYGLGAVIRGRFNSNSRDSQQAFGQSYYVPMPNATGLSGADQHGQSNNNSRDSQQAFGQSYYVPMPNATGLSRGGEGSVAPENAGPQYTIPPLQDSSAEVQVREHTE